MVHPASPASTDARSTTRTVTAPFRAPLAELDLSLEDPMAIVLPEERGSFCQTSVVRAGLQDTNGSDFLLYVQCVYVGPWLEIHQVRTLAFGFE
jgi:hypothetical protein